MSNLKTTGEAARLLNRPVHQVRRTLDKIWPDTTRAGRNRLIPAERLAALAEALAAQYGSRGTAQ